MNLKQSWTFSMSSRCPKCKEDVTFHGVFDPDKTEIVLDAVFIVLGMAIGTPLFLMDNHEAVRIAGASLLFLSTWTALVMLARQIYIKISSRGAAKWPPDPQPAPPLPQDTEH